VPLSKLVHRGLLFAPGGAMIHMSAQFSTTTVQNILDTYFKQVGKLLYIIATVLGFIVGVAQFVQRSWVENDINSKIADVCYRVLMLVNSASHKLALVIEEN